MERPVKGKPADMKISLKPCPFCGGEPRLVSSGRHKRIKCMKCLAGTTTRSNIMTVVDMWNRRI